jgi:hypothetical protein
VTAILWTVLVAVGVLGLLVTHELMHAVALDRIGVHTPRAGLGFFYPRWKAGTLRFGDRPTEVFVSPWLLGAWVSPDTSEDALDRINAARWRPYSWYVGAGVWINTVTGCALLALWGLCRGYEGTVLVFGGAAVVVALLTDWFTAYIAPLLWPASIALLGWTVVDQSAAIAAGDGQPLGFVGIARALVAHDPVEAVALLGVIALGLAVSNMLPFVPLDGGAMFTRLLRVWRVPPRVRTIVEYVGVVLVLGIFVLSEVSDVAFW